MGAMPGNSKVAARNTSWLRVPTICIPIGGPSSKRPMGTEMAGTPAMAAGAVKSARSDGVGASCRGARCGTVEPTSNWSRSSVRSDRRACASRSAASRTWSAPWAAPQAVNCLNSALKPAGRSRSSAAKCLAALRSHSSSPARRRADRSTPVQSTGWFMRRPPALPCRASRMALAISGSVRSGSPISHCAKGGASSAIGSATRAADSPGWPPNSANTRATSRTLRACIPT